MATSHHIPTKGRLGQGLWQAVKGLLFQGETPTPVIQPEYCIVSLLEEEVTLGVIDYQVSPGVIDYRVTLEVLPI